MKVKHLLNETFKQASSDCVIESQSIMMRGGYYKYVQNGCYSLFNATKRITRKIEDLIREEMDKIGGQEVLLPVVMPATLWEESGRYTSIGSEMIRLKDRNGNNLVLGMTHEEAAVHLARNTAKSYVQYPFMIYQIQTKFRDELRPRGGLIRVREFTMKDAYSFHTSQEDLLRYYEKCYSAYNRIFKKVGIDNFIAVKSDSGMMGGNISHEFMLLSNIGEDSLAICKNCDYKANVEMAQVIIRNEQGIMNKLVKIHTPNVKNIKELCELINIDSTTVVKSVVYRKNTDNSYVIVFTRGDIEVNEAKLRKYINDDIYTVILPENNELVAGFIGPLGLNVNGILIFDKSLYGIENLVCGANENNYHFIGFNIERDIGKIEYVDVAKIQDGFLCPDCSEQSIVIENGIEIGNIFQLGTKYTMSMNMTYLDKNGELKYPIMGCYGIGVGRLCASICEEHHDDYGPIWPITIAPWQVEICSIRVDNGEVVEVSDHLYNLLIKNGIEVLYDDRNLRAGVMFADADLFGIPLRIIVSPKTVAKGVVEFAYRDKSYNSEVEINDVLDTVKNAINLLLKQYDVLDKEAN